MKKLLYVLIGLSGWLYGQQFEWAQRLGGEGEDVAKVMFVDDEGFIYTSGYFTGTATFEYLDGQTEITSNGSFDIYLSKMSADGDLVWMKSFGGAADDYPTSIYVDESKNVYLTGIFMETMNFGGDPLESAGLQDIFILKLNEDGEHVWSKSIGGTFYEESTSIVVDSHGKVYLSGYFYLEMDFDPSEEIYILTPTDIGDSFFVKLSENGDFEWAKQIGGQFTLTFNMKLFNDELYAVGNFRGNGDFDPDPASEYIVGAVGFESFLLHLDSFGNFKNVVTSRALDPTAGSSTLGLTVDSEGNAIITGYFGGTIDFAPEIDHGGEYTFTTNQHLNAFVMKVDNEGNVIWVRHVTPETADANSLAYGVAVNSSGDIYFSGFFAKTVNFGGFELTHESMNFEDAYVAHMTSEGEFVNVYQFGGADFIDGHDIGVDSQNNVYLYGAFDNTVDLDPSPFETYNISTRGLRDTYLIKIRNGQLNLQDELYSNKTFAYPNPSSGIINLNAEEELSGKKFRIFDMTGINVLEGKVSAYGQISFESLPSGIYLIDIDSRHKIKIIKK